METIDSQVRMSDQQAAAGAAVYNRLVLSIYDLFVLGFSNTFAWKCPSRKILDFYNQHVSARHIDVGVGTGFFLDKCRFPSGAPLISLVDLNSNSLQVTARRLDRYRPATHAANILEPLRLEARGFESAGLNYLFHCLPGNMMSKGVVFRNLKPLLAKEAVVFGTTILGKGVRHNNLARRLMDVYNSKGIFSNRNDSLADLENVLKENFTGYSVHLEGCVAFFAGRV